MSNYYVTTSIPYVNGDPHIGFGMELVVADVLARYARQQGIATLFSTGTDEHGSKVAEKAAELKQDPKTYAAQMSRKFADLLPLLNISNDRFVRTTDPAHEKRAQMIWTALKDNIYKGTYTGWYCVGCEAFKTEQEVKDNQGLCPIHRRKYEKLEEQNYFFSLSKYASDIEEAIVSDAFRIIPQSRKNEALSVIKAGLEDISISRPRTKLQWGVPVPGDKDQVMYVWFEALMNYITVLGYPEHKDFAAFWPASIQVIGKDILRFHAAIWPGLLMALKLPLPKTLYVHGFINVDGKKMSKSLGNVISPVEIIKKYNADVFRYFITRHVPSYEDGDFTWERIEAAYNNELADQLGNAVSRTAAMVTQYQQGLIGDIPSPAHDTAQYHEALAACHFDRALDEVWEQVKGLNQYIDETKPWELAKNRKGDEDNEHLREVLAYMAGCLLEIAELLNPFMPETAGKIAAVFKDGYIRPLPGTLFPKTDTKKVA